MTHKICYIIGAMEIFPMQNPGMGERFRVAPGDLIIAADAGWQRAKEIGLMPDLAVGDFDTAPPPKDIPAITHPLRKDDTDLMLAVRIGLERGYRCFVLLGVSGGRPDHVIAAYQTLLWLAEQGGRGYLFSEGMIATVLKKERMRLSCEEGTLFSLFAVGGRAEGVTLKGASYPLTDALLTPDFPLGISNRFTTAPLEIALRSGNLLCFVEGGFSLVPAIEAGRQACDF